MLDKKKNIVIKEELLISHIEKRTTFRMNRKQIELCLGCFKDILNENLKKGISIELDEVGTFGSRIRRHNNIISPYFKFSSDFQEILQETQKY